MKLRVVKQDNHGLCLAVDGINSDFMERYKVLARPYDDDMILKTGFEAWACFADEDIQNRPNGEPR